MLTTVTPFNPMRQLLQSIVPQLQAVDRLSIPLQSIEHVRTLVILRVARLMETALPHHVGHGERTARYAHALGRAAGMTGQEQQDLNYAALLHDIGLLKLPTYLTARHAQLSEEEYVLVQSHPREGAEIIRDVGFLTRAARLIAHHHEHWDGSGYPYGVRGDYVPLAARVLAIADAFDSLMSQFQSVKRSLRMVQSSSGTHFDPRLVSLFVQLPLHQEQSHDRSIACIPSTYPSGVGCALPLRAGEGASVPSEPPSPYHSLNKALRLPRKDERPRFR